MNARRTVAHARRLLPAPEPELSFTAIITLRPEGSGTQYVATAVHKDPDGRKQHEEMGFHEGWGKALDQLVGYAQSEL